MVLLLFGIAQPQPHLTVQNPRLALPLPFDPALKTFGRYQPVPQQRHRCAAWS